MASPARATPHNQTQGQADAVRDYLTERAKSKGVNLSDLVNDLLRKDIALVEGLK
jgi:molybdopterin-guanine dinucleotide biosynthesis protein